MKKTCRQRWPKWLSFCSHETKNESTDMTYLILGLILFLGVHSLRMVGEGWRTRVRASAGEATFKGV